ncbi:hypothetical protein [Diaphorobacter sp. J5-51]|uniref:hypothetical protein n=1 Tax=Diaphorobacter sp. J5-51 TaxID=680496 RepID=UPI0006435A90|nr:hypothetical protein [Diaphorobacter sp. J5-51]KLR59287.1 hypothetical protein OX89_02550 [Diaphorobacter sp. J5-51]
MKYEEIYAQMKIVAEAAKQRGLLQAYEQDFYLYDNHALQSGWTPEGKFLWVITPNGTHLTEIGIHPKQNDWALATVHSGYKTREIYLVSANGIKQLTVEKAESEIKKLDYIVDGSTIKDKTGEVLAYMRLKPIRSEARQGGQIRFNRPDNLPYTERLKHVLGIIANSEIAKYYGSWFVVTESIVFD